MTSKRGKKSYLKESIATTKDFDLNRDHLFAIRASGFVVSAIVVGGIFIEIHFPGRSSNADSCSHLKALSQSRQSAEDASHHLLQYLSFKSQYLRCSDDLQTYLRNCEQTADFM